MLRNLNHEFRIDAEYYREEVLNRLDVLDRHNNDDLENLAEFVIGPFGSTVTADQYVNDSECRYVRNKDIHDFLIKESDPAMIPHEIYDPLPRYHIKENDLLITVVGTLGKVAIATKKDTKSIFSCKSTIIRTKRINPFYLLTYLNTETGKLFSLRGKRGAIQEGLNLPDLKEIKVFIPSGSFQGFIERIIKQSFANTENATNLFKQAQTLLLSELGLTDWQPKQQLSFVKNYSDAEQAGRMDAEYFQPKYEEIIHAIETYSGSWDTLGNLVSLKDQNHTPKSDKEYKYIELSNIAGNGEITGCTIESGSDLPSRARRKVDERDVIVSSIEGSLSSIALVGEEYDQALCSTGFYVINSSFFYSEALLVLMKSIAGQMLLKKGCNGTILTAINKDEFLNIPLPKLDETKQLEIQQKVTESFNLRKQSKHLLECAKRAVEIAIEQDEKIAIQWLKVQTKEQSGSYED